MKDKLGILFLISIMFFSCNKENEVKPIVKDIKELVFASGELEWDGSYNLTAQTDGVVNNATFEIGNKVSKGTVLAIIDNKTNQINVQTAERQLAISNENLTTPICRITSLKSTAVFSSTTTNPHHFKI